MIRHDANLAAVLAAGAADVVITFLREDIPFEGKRQHIMERLYQFGMAFTYLASHAQFGKDWEDYVFGVADTKP